MLNCFHVYHRQNYIQNIITILIVRNTKGKIWYKNFLVKFENRTWQNTKWYGIIHNRKSAINNLLEVTIMWFVMYLASIVGVVFGCGMIVIDFWYIRFGFSFAMFVIGFVIALVSAYVNTKLTNWFSNTNCSLLVITGRDYFYKNI